jgi:hypothetical protein
MAIIKNKQTDKQKTPTNGDENVRKKERLLTVGGNIN